MSDKKTTHTTTIPALTKSVNDILKASSRKHVQLRESCKQTLELLQKCKTKEDLKVRNHGDSSCPALPVLSSLVTTMSLACETKSTKMVTFALESTLRLVAAGAIRGTVTAKDSENIISSSLKKSTLKHESTDPDKMSEPAKKAEVEKEEHTIPVVDKVINYVSHCYDISDSKVQLLAIKICLHCITQEGSELHGAALMCGVRTCFNIYLYSHTPGNISAAKKSLSKMIAAIYERYEKEFAASGQQGTEGGAQAVTAEEVNNVIKSLDSSECSEASDISEVRTEKDFDDDDEEEDKKQEEEIIKDVEEVKSEVKIEVNEDKEIKNEEDKEVKNEEEKEDKEDKEEKDNEEVKEDKEEKDNEEVKEDKEEKDNEEVKEVNKDIEEDKKDNEEKEVKKEEENNVEEDKKDNEEKQKSPTEQVIEKNVNEEEEDGDSIALKDCLLLFRALCNISMKTITKDHEFVHGEETIRELRSKALSLELLFGLIEGSGPALKGDHKFIEKAIKAHLCKSIVQNGVSTNPKILKYTLSITYSLIKHFRSSLKAEIGVFMSNIFLRVLETQNSTLQQKWLVLQLLHHICKDPQVLIELYINYDCDLNSTDVLVRMVNDLARVSQGDGTTTGATGASGTSSASSGSGSGSSSSSGSRSNAGSAGGANGSNAGISDSLSLPEQEMTLRNLSLECLVLVMGSLERWTREGQQQLTRIQQQFQQQELEQRRRKMAEAEAAVAAKEKGEAEESGLLGVENEEGEVDDELKKLRAQKERKRMLEDIRERWALDTKRALAYMQKVGVIDDTAESLAKFLRETEGLDKKATGEFIGGSKPFNKDVLKAYVALFNFAGMELDEALRFFLGQFLLPGEGQVVDRIMENFGQRYYLDNAESKRFEDADAVYKLSFAIIMLATDIHNPKVKNKLTFEQWEKMVNKDLAMGLDVEYLRGVFSRIAAKKLELVDDGSKGSASGSSNSSSGIGSILNPRQRQMMLVEETSRWIENSLKKIQDCDDGSASSLNTSGEYLTAKRTEYVQPIFESIWASAVVALSILLESSEDARVIELCLSGFKYGIHVAAAFFMETERSAFVTALEKFTSLTGIREMRPKNVGAIRTLIGLAKTEGDYLQGSWVSILRCVSLIERLHLYGSGAEDALPEYKPFKGGNASSGRAAAMPRRSIAEKLPRGLAAATATLMGGAENTQEVIAALGIENADIDRLFSSSVTLNDNAIVHFVKALCEVSLSEISEARPRIFSLQRIVEVASFNMNNRMRFVWSEVWVILKEYFIKCGRHPMEAVAVSALDSLRQLSMKYLEKDELASYNFQKEFLKPFEVLIATTDSDSVVDFAINCLRQIVTARTANIASGWKTIFVIFATCAEQDAGALLPVSFELLSDIMRNYYDIAATNFFVEIVASLVAYGKNPTHTDISNRAVAFLYTCAEKLAATAGRAAEKKEHEQSESGEVKEDGEVEEKKGVAWAFTDQLSDLSAWFPILTGLGEIAAHPHIDVRTNALTTFFSILSNNAELFSPKLWTLIFRNAILPIFANVGYVAPAPADSQGTEGGAAARPVGVCVPPAESAEWLSTTCLSALQSLAALFAEHFETISFLLQDVFDLLAALVYQDNVTLANFGSVCFFQIVMENGAKFTRDMWAAVDSFLEAFFAHDDVLSKKVIDAAVDAATDKKKREEEEKKRITEEGDVDKEESGEELKKEDEHKDEEGNHKDKEDKKDNEEDKKEDDESKKDDNISKEGEEDEDDKEVDIEEDSTAENDDELGIITRKCAVCGTVENEKAMLKCPLCGSVYYCSEKCQEEDWEKHQSVCLAKKSPMKLRHSVTNITTSRFVMLSPSKNKIKVVASSVDAARVPQKEVVARCEIVRCMMKPIEDMVFKQYDALSTADITRIVTTLKRTLDFTTEVTCTETPRTFVREVGYYDLFIRKERDLTILFMKVCFHIYGMASAASLDEDIAERGRFAEGHAMALCKHVLEQHLGDTKNESRLQAVLLALELLLDQRDDQYDKHYPEFYVILARMIGDHRRNIRALVCKHFERMGKRSGITKIQ